MVTLMKKSAMGAIAGAMTPAKDRSKNNPQQGAMVKDISNESVSLGMSSSRCDTFWMPSGCDELSKIMRY